MTSHSKSTESRPSDESSPDWSWLQQRVETVKSDQLGQWLEEQLATLEESFAHLITPRSRSKELRAQLDRENSRND